MRRRDFLGTGGILAASLPLAPGLAFGNPAVEIAMRGNADGSKVWFDPYGIRIRPGETLRWVNGDKGNSHTVTAYTAENDDHPRRIPEGAASFDSDYLLPGESFEVTFDVPGIYDYFCIPHEMAGMVGRVLVLPEGGDAAAFSDYPAGDLDPMILEGFPTVADIAARGPLHHQET